MTSTHKIKFRTPDVLSTAVQEIQGVAALIDVSDTYITVEVKADSDFEAGELTKELADTLTATFCEQITYHRVEGA